MRYGHHAQGDDLLGDYLASRGEGFGPEPRRRILIGTYVLSAGYYDAYYNRAHAVRRLIRQDFADAFSRVDVIATPTAAGPAFRIGEKVSDPVQLYLEDVFTVPANHAGIPALSVPSGTVSEDGKELPLGVQFMGPHLSEKRLCAIGKRFLGESN
jgi:aspartyl-tRNA(Asn)/glutamyl-tRNA(Gln) amidotransferase subunit A